MEYTSDNNDNYAKEFSTAAAIGAALSAGSLAIGGLGKGLALHNQKKAQKILTDAHEQYALSYQTWKQQSDAAKRTITEVVTLKKQILITDMKRFLKAYRRLSPNIELKQSQGIGELKKFTLTKEHMKELNDCICTYQSYDTSCLKQKIHDISILMVQDGTVNHLTNSLRDIIYAAKANDDELKQISTDNLKIQSIHVISQFSTAALEFGISGISDALSSGNYLKEAKEAAARYQMEKQCLDIYTVRNNAIYQYAEIHKDLLSRYLPIMKEFVSRSVQIIREKDNFLHIGRISEDKFTEEEGELLAFTMSLAGTVKAIIDSPIIASDGTVFDGDTTNVTIAQNEIKKLEAGNYFPAF